MTLFGWIISAISCAMGITLAIVAYRTYGSSISSNDQALRKAVWNSVLSGVSVSLIFAGAASIITFRDPGQVEPTGGILAIILISLVAGIIATVGSLWQFYLAGKFRRYLSKRIGKDNKN